MLRRTTVSRGSNHSNRYRQLRWADHKYKELNNHKREAMGITKWDEQMSHRAPPQKRRFYADSVMVTKGTSKEAWKWWYSHQAFLPNIRPDDVPVPEAQGVLPPAWDEEFAASLTSLSNAELREQVLQDLTTFIFEETQRDGYELRRLDFEQRALTDLPNREIIEQFVFEEETLFDRCMSDFLEGLYRLVPTSEDRKELRSVENIIRFITTHVTYARPPRDLEVTDAVKEVLAKQPVQPKVGFAHALPEETRDPLLVEWERLHHHDWQFGKAVYEPRSRENTRGNIHWMRQEKTAEARQQFQQYVASGEAARDQKRRLAEAAGQA